jgi:hypothetical protein
VGYRWLFNRNTIFGKNVGYGYGEGRIKNKYFYGSIYCYYKDNQNSWYIDI